MSFSRELEKPRRGRIHELATRQTERENAGLEFDVGKYVGDREWQVLSSRLMDWLCDSPRGDDGVRMAAKMKFIDPERFASLGRSVRLLLEHKVRTDILDNDFASDAWMVKSMAILYPEKLNVWLPERENRVGERFYNLLGEGYLEVALEEGEAIKLADLKNWSLTIPEDSWKEMEKKLIKLFRDKEYHRFLEIAASMKIIAPDRFKKFVITQEMWNKFISMIEGVRQEYFKENRYVPPGPSPSADNPFFSAFVSYIECMKILAAEKVEMTEHGIEVTMPKKNEHKETIPGRPIRQNF